MTFAWFEVEPGRRVFRKVRDEAADDKRSDLPCPMVMPDTPGYMSPLGDGKFIEGRAARREHLKANNCVEVDRSDWQKRSEQFKATRAEREAQIKADRAAVVREKPALKAL